MPDTVALIGNIVMSLRLTAAVFAVALSIGGAASAATCNATLSAAISPNAGCQTGAGNDSVSAVSALFPSIDGLAFIAKDNDLDGTDEGMTSALTVSGDRMAGTFSISSAIFDMYDSVVVVLKGPSSPNSDPANTFLAYLLNEAGSYSYESPFTNRNGESQNLSHITLYAGDKDVPVVVVPPIPLPASAFLLAGGLAGLGALRRRKARAA